jgi:hypothetical protein
LHRLAHRHVRVERRFLKTMPMRAGRADGGSPSTLIAPDAASRRPMSRLTSVLLPDPFGPSSRIDPAGTSSGAVERRPIACFAQVADAYGGCDARVRGPKWLRGCYYIQIERAESPRSA